MPSPNRIPRTLTGAQVVALEDALQANTDDLVRAATTLIESPGAGRLAQTLAMVAVEEAGKLIGLHRRRSSIVREQDGTAFVDDHLRRLWGDDTLKYRTVRDYLKREPYRPSMYGGDEREDLRLLVVLKRWERDRAVLLRSGLHIDLTRKGAVVERRPTRSDDVRLVLDRVGDIGWQIALAEHHERERLTRQRDGEPQAEAAETWLLERALEGAAQDGDDEATGALESVLESMRAGTPPQPVANADYSFLRTRGARTRRRWSREGALADLEWTDEVPDNPVRW